MVDTCFLGELVVVCFTDVLLVVAGCLVVSFVVFGWFVVDCFVAPLVGEVIFFVVC